MMPPPDVFDADLAAIENTLRSSVPDVIRKRLRTGRDLLVYGAFCYEFIAVSVLWSLTCIEMALWEKFTELHPGPLTVEDRKGNTETITANELASRLQGRFRIVGMPNFNGSFRSLVDWAAEQRLVEDPEMLRGMVRLRNSFAHPKEFIRFECGDGGPGVRAQRGDRESALAVGHGVVLPTPYRWRTGRRHVGGTVRLNVGIAAIR